MKYEEQISEHNRLSASIEERLRHIFQLCEDFEEIFPDLETYLHLYDENYIASWTCLGSYISVYCEYTDPYDSIMDRSNTYMIPTEWLDMNNEDVVEHAKTMNEEARNKSIDVRLKLLKSEVDHLGYKLVKKEV